MELVLLKELVIVLAAAVVVISISQKLRIPGVAGFLLTGVLIGPAALRFVRETQVISTLAEVGVVMLLFAIGLEFSPARLRQIRRDFLVGGGLQVGLSTLATVLILLPFGFPVPQAVFYGFLVSLSSTAVVLRVLAERGELDAPHGRVSLGILLFQDLAVVPMIALVPVLANAGVVAWGKVAGRFVLSLAVVVAVVIIARFLAPRFLHIIVRTRVREVFLIAALFLCLGMSLMTASLGLSLALGAFLAGIVISESAYSHQVVADILPFRDLFNSLFFISIGMLLDLRAVASQAVLVALLVVSLFLLKALAVLVAVRVRGYGGRIALTAALSLAQVGEFSFVLAGVGRANGLIPDWIFQGFLASAIVTIFATPFLITLSSRVAERAEKVFRWKCRPSEAEERAAAAGDHVIIAGYGLNGRNLARVLRETGIPYIVLDLNPDAIREARAEGETVLFGDVASPQILKAAGIARAKAVVFAISDPGAARRGVRIARELGPEAFILVRTRYAAQVDELYRLGADAVIPEEFETSLEIFVRVLEKYYIPRNIIEAEVAIIRSEGYGFWRQEEGERRPTLDRISDVLSAGTAQTFLVVRESPAAGKTVGELRLRTETGATIVAVVRGESSFTSPRVDFRIEAGDILVLVASHRDMDRACSYLRTGHEGKCGEV